MEGPTRRPEVVFFDAAGTLFEVRGSVGEIYSRLARRYGVQSDADELERAFAASFRAQSSDPCLAPEDADQTTAERRWWREVVERVLGGAMDARAFEEYFEEVFEIFRTPEAWVLFPDTIPALHALCRKGFRLGIISNFDSRLDDLLPGLGLDGYFEETVISWRAGAAKPDGRIFSEALRLTGTPPGAALHVGDSVTEDAEGALASGMQAALLDRRRLHSGWTRSLRIDRLTDLTEMLGDP